jgi:NitT/TauT family transport system substrate-binding protein
MKKTSIIIVIAVLLLILFAGCANQPTQEDNKIKTSVRLPISVWNAWFGSFAAAEAKGYFAEENLDVKINLGSPELNPVKMVVSGADDFGVLGGPDTLLVARSKGAPIVAIAVLQHDKTFPCIMSLKNSGITKVSDLEGKKIGFFYGHISTDIIHALLKQEGVKNYKEVDVGGYNFTPLVSGQVDAEWCFITDAVLNLKHEGIEVNVISPQDYGMIVDTQTIFTTEKMIKESPEKVEKFLRATLEGIKFSLENTEETIGFLAKKESNLVPEIERERFALINLAADNKNSKKFGLGYMNREIFERAYKRMSDNGLIEKPFDVSEAYTTQFLDKINGK